MFQAEIRTWLCKLLEIGLLTWCKAGNFAIIGPHFVDYAEYRHCPNYAVVTFRKVRRNLNFWVCRNWVSI